MVKSRQRWVVDNVYEVDLGDQSVAFARLLNRYKCEFFNWFQPSGGAVPDLNSLKPAFSISIGSSVFTSPNWKFIGRQPCKNPRPPIRFFKRDIVTKAITIVDENWENEVEAREADVTDLERAANWGAIHIENRLRDLRDGKPNKSYLALR